MEVNIEESWHFGSANKSVSAMTPSYDVHVVTPEGQVKRCQINKNRQFSFLDYTWKWNAHQTKIVGISDVGLKPELVKAGFKFLQDYFEEEGKPEGYAEYKKWEATCDSIANRSAEFKEKAIPDVRKYLPRKVVRMQEDHSASLDFGSAMFDDPSEPKQEAKPEKANKYSGKA